MKLVPLTNRPKKAPPTPELVAQVKALKAEGKTKGQIRDLLDIKESTVDEILYRRK